MYNKQLMNPKTLELYEKIISALREIRKEHRKLIDKAKKKTITSDESKQLRELINVHNHLEKIRQKIWDNHSLLSIIKKNQR